MKVVKAMPEQTGEQFVCKCEGCCGYNHWSNFGGGSHHMGIHVVRWLLAIVALFAAFGLGLKVGELKTYLREWGSGYGGSRMMMYGSPMMEKGNVLFYRSDKMMTQPLQVTPTPSTTTSTKTSTKK